MDLLRGTLGCTGDRDVVMPRQEREVIFGRGVLTRACVDELRNASGSPMSHTIAEGILSVSGRDARNRNLKTEDPQRVSKAFRSLKKEGRATAGRTSVDHDVAAGVSCY